VRLAESEHCVRYAQKECKKKKGGVTFQVVSKQLYKNERRHHREKEYHRDGEAVKYKV